MQTKRARRRAVLALAGALLLLAESASASHDLRYDVTQTSYATSAHANVTGYTYYGSYTPKSGTLDVPAGYDVAQHTGTGAPWPSTDNPSDEEVVGSGTARARWKPFCAPSSNLSLTVKWETTIPNTAPSGTVSMVTIEAAGGLFTTEAFIVKETSSDYKIETPDMPDEDVCDSTTDGELTLTINGTTADGSKVVRNPASAGNYTWTTTYADDNTPSASHTDSDVVAIS